MDENQLFRDFVWSGIVYRKHTKIDKIILEREVVFIENRHLESYFNVAHCLIEDLKCGGDLVGPGNGWMVRSYVCWLLGITCFNPASIGLEPLLTWCDSNKNPIIDIEVDSDSFHKVYKKAITMYGYNNVARMPALLSDKSNLSEQIGITQNGVKVYLHCCALLICQEGSIRDYYPVQEITDENGNKILCTKEFIPECDNKTVFRFNILKSHELTRIKRIQELITANGKRLRPQLGDLDILDEKYVSFRSGSFKGIPFFESLKNYEKNIKMLLNDSYHVEYQYLLNIMVLFIWGVGQNLVSENDIKDFQCKYGINTKLWRYEYPWGILFKEDVAHIMNSWIGFTWKQIAHIMELIEKPNQVEIEEIKQIFFQNGIENAFKEDELNKIWASIFNREEKRPLLSKSQLAGGLYLSVFLAKLKVEFEDEFMQQYEEEQE